MFERFHLLCFITHFEENEGVHLQQNVIDNESLCQKRRLRTFNASH
jgi:hypothetical protein